MCTFISVSLPVSADVVECRHAFHQHGLSLTQAEDHPKGILKTENYFFTCSAHCDCGTKLGSAHLAKGHDTTHDHERFRKELKRKGWSDAKILRRLDDLKKNQAKEKRAQEASDEHQGDELLTWTNLIEELLTNKMASHVGITVNDYNGPLSNPKFSLKRTHVARNVLTTNSLSKIEPAELLVIH